MTNFYKLLRQSIIDRNISDAMARETVYRQARQAVIKQLWNFQPPLGSEEIDRRVEEFDASVDAIEEELVDHFSGKAMAVSDDQPAASLSAEDDVAPEDSSGNFEPVDEETDADHEEDSGDAEWDQQGDLPEALMDDEAYADDDGYYDDTADDHPAPYAEEQENEAEPPPPVIGSPIRKERAEKQNVRRHERWDGGSKDIVRQARSWWQFADDGNKIRVLAIAIAVLLLALAALVAFMFLAPGNRAPAQVAPIETGTVSDAATAARLADTAFEVRQSYTVFDGRDPTVFITSPDNPVRFDATGGFATISTSASSPGVRVQIGPGLATQLAGERIRVTLVARSSPDFGAASLRFSYQSGVARSHWQTANLAADFDGAAMVWQPPGMRTDVSGDYLLIEPGIPGDGTSADIQSIRIDVLPRE